MSDTQVSVRLVRADSELSALRKGSSLEFEPEATQVRCVPWKDRVTTPYCHGLLQFIAGHASADVAHRARKSRRRLSLVNNPYGNYT